MTHPEIAPLAFLVGRWTGVGSGVYPTIDPFDYTEDVTITATPKPVLRYEQRTADAATGEGRHMESGWFRLAGHGPELVIAQPTGITEVHMGVLTGQRLELRSIHVGLTASAATHAIEEVHRVITVEGDIMRYVMSMASVGHPLQVHLQAQLERI